MNSSMRSFHLEVGLLPLLNKWQRLHFRSKAKIMKDLAWQVVAQLPTKWPVLRRCRIEIERQSSVAPDWDNLAASAKPLLDVLAVRSARNPHGIGLIADDSPRVIEALISRHSMCQRKHGKTLITITELSE